MISFILLDLQSLSDEDLLEYQNLLKEPFWQALRGKDPWEIESAKIFAVAAISEGRPVGLAVATLRIHTSSAKLLSLYIKEEFRNQKIATNLLSHIQQILQKEHCRVITHDYLTGQPTTPYLESIFKKFGWTPPKLFLARCYYYSAEFHPAWIDREYHFPKGFEVFPWKNITLKEKEHLKDLLKRELIPYGVSPFHDENTIEPINSLGLRKDGEIIGWNITNRTDPDTINYSSLYIDRKYKFKGYSIFLLATAIQLQQKAKIPNATLDLNLEQVDHNWIRFVKERSLPHSYKVERFNQTARIFEPNE